MKENVDIIIFTSILLLLFLLFGIGTYREFVRMEKDKFDSNTEKGGAENFLKFITKIFDN